MRQNKTKGDYKMNDVLKHVVVIDERNDRRSLVAVLFDSMTGDLVVETLAGKPPYSDVLVSILDVAMPGWADEAEELHLSRKRYYHVRKRVGLSGCVDYKLYSCRDLSICDWPLSACLHISMCSKLNQGVRCWLGDLPPLLAAVDSELYPEGVTVRAYEPENPEDYKIPGSASGLLKRLEKQDAELCEAVNAGV